MVSPSRRPWAGTAGTSSAATSTRRSSGSVADAMVSSRHAATPATSTSSSTTAGRAARRRRPHRCPIPSAFPPASRRSPTTSTRAGLKFGIYSDAGRTTCGGRPGSQGHEYQDARTYAAWGVDYLKYDWCNDRHAQCRGSLRADGRRAARHRPRHRLQHLRMGQHQALAVGAEYRPPVAHHRRHLRQLGRRRPTGADRRHEHRRPQRPLWPVRRARATGTTPTCSRSATAA